MGRKAKEKAQRRADGITRKDLKKPKLPFTGNIFETGNMTAFLSEKWKNTLLSLIFA